jgi:hypothetical protein
MAGRKWLFVVGVTAGVVVAVGVTLAITLSGSSRPAAVQLTDSSLCSDVNLDNAAGTAQNNETYRYLALHLDSGYRAGFESACREDPNLPVAQALIVAPAREHELFGSPTTGNAG